MLLSKTLIPLETDTVLQVHREDVKESDTKSVLIKMLLFKLSNR